MNDGIVWVCEDCYFAHHYGHRDIVVVGRLGAGLNNERAGRAWVVGPDFSYPENVADREPLRLLDGYDLYDNTDAETDEGIDTFSWSSCDGCGSTLGGSRYRLAIHHQED